MNETPLLDHPHQEPSAFRPDDLVQAVREQRAAGPGTLPPVGVLEFDGDLTDSLIRADEVCRCESWACFHTEMWLWPKAEPRCGIVTRTIGGPYTVLIAEQMAVSGMHSVIGLASAGRLGLELPLPGIVVADEAVRDEGTSLHYLPPAETVTADTRLAEVLAEAVGPIGLPVRRGLVWTTDAPYRETMTQIERWAARGALAVEMQAAALFAFGAVRGVRTGLVAHVTNAVDYDGEPFAKGPDDADRKIFAAVVEAASRL